MNSNLTASPLPENSWRVRLFGIDARQLALFRLAIASILLVNLAGRAVDLRAMYTDEGIVPVQAARDFYATSYCWSLHWVSGSFGFQLFLFGVAFVAAGALLLGLFTRAATMVSWLLLVSLHLRNPLQISGGDMLLQMLLLWSIFLPLGNRWSLDSRRSASRSAERIVSAGSVAILLQIAFMYWSTGMHKWNAVWLSGDALELALSYDVLAKPAASLLLSAPLVLKALTYFTLAIELAAPLLLFCPWQTTRLRSGTLVTLVLLHLGIELTLDILIFSYVSLAGLLLFLPASVWRRGPLARVAGWLEHRTWAAPSTEEGSEAAPPSVTTSPRWANVVCGVLAVYSFAVNLGDQFAPRMMAELPRSVLAVRDLLVLDQHWTMFARLAPFERRYALLAELKDGSEVDVLRDGLPLSVHELTRVPADLPSQRWMHVFVTLSRDEFHILRHDTARYFYRRWNEKQPPERQIDLLAFVEIRLPVGGELESREPQQVVFTRIDSRVDGPSRFGRPHGHWVYRYENGQISAKGDYDRGRRVGHWTEWYPNGRKQAEGSYRNGEMHGRWILWEPTGDAIECLYDQGEVVSARRLEQAERTISVETP